MPTMIGYPTVLQKLTQQGLKSLYHNSGAFGFAASVATTSRGWIGEPDAAIREAALPLVRVVAKDQLADRFVSLWKAYLSGPVWIMPKSHWSYELEFGSKAWLPGALVALRVDWQSLEKQNVAPAIAFTEGEAESVATLLQTFLTHLDGSDFQAVFPGRQTICTIHHRGQLWWTTADPVVAGGMDAALASDLHEGG